MSIDSITDKHFKVMESLVSDIEFNCKCPMCGGSEYNEDTCKCKYCGSENKVLVFLIEQLKREIISFDRKVTALGINTLENNKVLNTLYSLHPIQITLIENILEKYNYLGYLNGVIKKVKSNYSDIDTYEKEAIKAIVFRHGKELNEIYWFILKSVLVNKPCINEDVFLVFIKYFIEDYTKEIYPNSRCIIKNEKVEDERIVLGSNNYQEISISLPLVRSLYNNGDIMLFFTMFHEIVHMQQSKNFSDLKKDDDMSMLCLMEFILSKNTQYYKENYSKISFELEARYYERDWAFDFLKNFGFVPTKEAIAENEKEKENIMNLLHDTSRTINGRKINIKEELDKVVKKDFNIFSRYPKLGLLYPEIEKNNKISR